MDHRKLVDIGVVKALTNPDDNPMNFISLSWGRDCSFGTLDTEKDRGFSLSKRITQVFSFFMRTAAASIMIDESGGNSDEIKELVDKESTSQLVEQILGAIKDQSLRYLMNPEQEHSTDRFQLK